MYNYYFCSKIDDEFYNHKLDISHLPKLIDKYDLKYINHIKSNSEIMKISYNYTGGGCLEIDTGMGKTVMAIYIMSLIKRKTIIIVHKEFLVNQWIERIQEFMPQVKISRIQGKTIDVENCHVVIAMLQSLFFNCW